MRRFCILLLFVLFVCLTQTTQANKYALLVGVDSYVNVPKLQCCVNDMKILKDALMIIGFEEENVYMLVTGASEFKDLPTKKNIERIISKILTNAQPSDMVFIAFSGHGAQEGKNVYFCPPEMEIDDLPRTCVSINKVMDILANKCEARFKWMVVDACRNDPNRGPKGIGGKWLHSIPTPPAGIALFQSCAEGEESWIDCNSGNSFFTKNFAAALSGEADSNHDGSITLMEVCTWTTAKTREQVKNSMNKNQRPYFSGTVSDFTLSEDVHVREAQELVAEAQNAMDEENYQLAIQKYDEAIALCPRFDTWKRERNLAQKLFKLQVEKPKPGDRKVETVNDVEFAFRWCPPDTFKMGSPPLEEGRHDYENQHQVTLSNGFWMMETEVTQKQWKAIMGTNPSIFTGDDYPVENVSWIDCQDFCKKCTQLGLPVQLPSEAQWEYACRAGTTDAYAGNLDDMAWYVSNSESKSHPVGTKKPNDWGLYDMHGNVWEWCADKFGDYPDESVTDPFGSSKESLRIVRGGGLNALNHHCRSASRSGITPTFTCGNLGFRCVKGQ